MLIVWTIKYHAWDSRSMYIVETHQVLATEKHVHCLNIKNTSKEHACKGMIMLWNQREFTLYIPIIIISNDYDSFRLVVSWNSKKCKNCKVALATFATI